MSDRTIDPNADNSPQAREACGEIKAETLETRDQDRREGEYLLNQSNRAEVGQGNQTATDLGDAVNQALTENNTNRS